MIRALMNPPANDWSVAQAREMYHIDRWGEGYYDINTAGRVVAKPLPGLTRRWSCLPSLPRRRNAIWMGRC